MQLFLETGRGAQAGNPRSVVTLPTWEAAEPVRWHLQPGGALRAEPAPVEGGATSYDYVPTLNPLQQFLPAQNTWTSPPPPGRTALWASAPLTEDVVMAGSGSVDLWLSSTASDTDVEVTLIEVRPDGQEMLLQSGWLRASRRALDEQASTALAPRHLHTAGAVAPLEPGVGVPLRVELFPFAHAFRAGSRIKVAVEAPGGNRWRWAFAVVPEPATNTIGHAAATPSSVVLPVLDVDVDLGGLPTCGAVSSQPCRPATLPVSGG